MTHPVVQAALDAAREFSSAVLDMSDRVYQVRSRRPSPHGLVIPEVDIFGRLTDLYIAPGTIDQFDDDELAAEIMAAILESTADAERRHRIVVDEAMAQLTARGADPVSGD